MILLKTVWNVIQDILQNHHLIAQLILLLMEKYVNLMIYYVNREVVYLINKEQISNGLDADYVMFCIVLIQDL